MIQINRLSKRFGTKEVLKAVSFEVNKGEVFGILGPNGSGKTTLLNLIAGIWIPSSGTVLISGMDIIKDELKIKRILGYVPDIPYSYPRLTGYEFLDFIGSLYNIELKERADRIQNLSKLLEIDEWLHNMTENYPRGVRQKLMLAAALLHRPSVLLADEPTANLDPKSARLIKDVFRKMASQGIAVVISTHILQIAEKICDRIAILDSGEIRAIGTMDKLRDIAKVDKKSDLEELFLRLTGGEEYKELISYLEA